MTAWLRIGITVASFLTGGVMGLLGGGVIADAGGGDPDNPLPVVGGLVGMILGAVLGGRVKPPEALRRAAVCLIALALPTGLISGVGALVIPGNARVELPPSLLVALGMVMMGIAGIGLLRSARWGVWMLYVGGGAAFIGIGVGSAHPDTYGVAILGAFPLLLGVSVWGVWRREEEG